MVTLAIRLYANAFELAKWILGNEPRVYGFVKELASDAAAASDRAVR